MNVWQEHYKVAQEHTWSKVDRNDPQAVDQALMETWRALERAYRQIQAEYRGRNER